MRSGEFALYFPAYADRPVVPVFSSLYVPQEVVTYLTGQGIYAVGMGEEAMEVLNLSEVRRQQADTRKRPSAAQEPLMQPRLHSGEGTT